MFEIKKTTSSNKTIRMPDNLIERLEHLATLHDISFNQLVVQCFLLVFFCGYPLLHYITLHLKLQVLSTCNFKCFFCA